MKARYLVALLNIVRIKGLFALIRDWRAFIRLHFLHAALESGLLRTLDSPASREELLAALEVARPELLDALLEVGVALKELRLDKGLYQVRGKRSRAVLRPENDMLAAMVEGNVTYYASAYRLAAMRMRGGPLGDDLRDIGGVVARYSKIGEPIIKGFLQGVARGMPSPRILDVGCGSGVFLHCLHASNPGATGAGIDLDPEVAAQAAENLHNWGLADRFAILAGDVRLAHPELQGPFDLITLFNILYYFPPEERLELFRGLSSLLAPGGRLIIAMNVRGHGRDIAAAHLNLVNASLNGLTVLPEAEALRDQLLRGGFRVQSEQRLLPGGAFLGLVAVRNS